MKKQGYIYCLYFPTSKRLAPYYIGKHFGTYESTIKRANSHQNYNENYSINNACHKYNNWQIIFLLENIPNNKLTYILEQHFIKLYKSYEYGYNETPGGDGGSFFAGFKHTKKQKEKWSKMRKGKGNPSYNPNKEIRICACKCGKFFECITTSKRKYINKNHYGKAKSKSMIGENNNGWILREIRFCTCGCGKTFKCRINSKRRYIHNHHGRKQQETRICICGCNQTFKCKTNSKRKYIFNHHKTGLIYFQNCLLKAKQRLKKQLKENHPRIRITKRAIKRIEQHIKEL